MLLARVSERGGEDVDDVAQVSVDLLLRGEVAAKTNRRDIVGPRDLPITKRRQESIHAFSKIDAEVEFAPALDRLTPRPPLELALGEETEAPLPEIVGGLSVALARSFTIIDPGLKNPGNEHWERSLRIFDLLSEIMR